MGPGSSWPLPLCLRAPLASGGLSIVKDGSGGRLHCAGTGESMRINLLKLANQPTRNSQGCTALLELSMRGSKAQSRDTKELINAKIIVRSDLRLLKLSQAPLRDQLAPL